jgi:hypothetical protein
MNGINNWKILLPFSALALIAITSIALVAYQFASLPTAGQDFPWVVARSLVLGVDPYVQYLEQDTPGPLFLAQTPNMWHSTYFLLAFFGSLPWPAAKWAYFFTNFLLSFVVAHLTARLFGLKGILYFTLIALFVISTPFRVTLFNGQYSVIALVFLTLFFLRPSIWSGIGAGVSFLKYSFAFPFALLVLRRTREWREMWWATLVPILGTLAFALTVYRFEDGESLIELFTNPISVALVGTASGVSDFASIVKVLAPDLHVFSLVTAVAISLVSILFLPSRKEAVFPSLSLVALSFFPHLIYDYVFLLPVLGFLLAFPSHKNLIFIAPTIVWHWYLFGLSENVLGSLYELPIVMGIGLILNIVAWSQLTRGNRDTQPAQA